MSTTETTQEVCPKCGTAGCLEDKAIDFAVAAEDDTPAAIAEEDQPGLAAEPDGYWACIAFMGHNEYTGYVTEIVKNGQPAYRVDLPEKIWGGNPLEYVEYAATAWFSERPLTEEFVRKAWEKHLRQLAERARQEAEWQRMRVQQALTAGADDEDNGYGEDLF